MYRTLVFGFYSDQATVDDQIFQGQYEFIDAGKFHCAVKQTNVFKAVSEAHSE